MPQRGRWIFPFCGIFTIFVCTVTIKAERTVQDAASEANVAYQSKDWSKSAQLYDKITKEQPANGRAWYRLGASLHGTGADEKAIAAFQKAAEAGVPSFIVEFAIAQAYASMKNADKAFEYLDKAAQHGYAQPGQLKGEKEFEGLRNDSRFAKIIEQTEHNQKPCTYTAENRQFDFWLGEWDVVTTNGGQDAGKSKIELILGDCVVLENWTSIGSVGYEGKSYNTYNSSLKRWEQFWADNSAGMIHFYGGLKDKIMDYWADELPQPDGTKLKRHLQFIPLAPDKVRQFSQGSTDGGKTWHVEYDFTYNRKK